MLLPFNSPSPIFAEIESTDSFGSETTAFNVIAWITCPASKRSSSMLIDALPSSMAHAGGTGPVAIAPASRGACSVGAPRVSLGRDGVGAVMVSSLGVKAAVRIEISS